MVARPLRLGGRNSRRRIPRGAFHHRLFQGRALYGAIATYHAYLEFPVLLALIMSPDGEGEHMPKNLRCLKPLWRSSPALCSTLHHVFSASGTS
jgi:hypothetical protein